MLSEACGVPGDPPLLWGKTTPHCSLGLLGLMPGHCLLRAPWLIWQLGPRGAGGVPGLVPAPGHGLGLPGWSVLSAPAKDGTEVGKDRLLTRLSSCLRVTVSVGFPPERSPER